MLHFLKNLNDSLMSPNPLSDGLAGVDGDDPTPQVAPMRPQGVSNLRFNCNALCSKSKRLLVTPLVPRSRHVFISCKCRSVA